MTREEARRRFADSTMQVARGYGAPHVPAVGGITNRGNLRAITAARAANHRRVTEALAARGVALTSIERLAAADTGSIRAAAGRPAAGRRIGNQEFRASIHRGIFGALVRHEVISALANYQARLILGAMGRI
jgi:hypothetical protein